MRKIIFVLAVLVFAAPTWAAVSVTAAQTDVNEVTISYSADANLPRAFALEISITSEPNDFVSIVGVDPNNLSFDYYIYPGSIVITGGEVTDYGTPAVAGQDANSMILEMGSLYAPEDTEHPDEPPPSGDLCIIILGGCGSGILTIEENAERGGVVMEDPYEPVEPILTGCTVTLPPCEVWCDQFCFPGCNSPDPNTDEFEEWRSVGEPNCWCASINPRQCHGDACNNAQGRGNYWVSTNDLSVLLAAWNKSFPQIEGQTYNIGGTVGEVPLICADFDHAPQGRAAYRVSTYDLTILLDNWNQNDLPEPNCP